MTPFWTYVIAAVLYTLAGLATGGVVGFFRCLGNDPWWPLEAIASVIAWPIALVYFGVLFLRRLWQ